MEQQITKTRIKQLNELLRFGKGKARLHSNIIRDGHEVSRSLIDQLINADGRVPNGITDKVRLVFTYAERLEKEIKSDLKKGK